MRQEAVLAGKTTEVVLWAGVRPIRESGIRMGGQDGDGSVVHPYRCGVGDLGRAEGCAEEACMLVKSGVKGSGIMLG